MVPLGSSGAAFYSRSDVLQRRHVDEEEERLRTVIGFAMAWLKLQCLAWECTPKLAKNRRGYHRISAVARRNVALGAGGGSWRMN
jgi:hypothetical protein